MKQLVKEFFDRTTWTLTYVVYDASTRDAVIIDPVWDYDPAASKLSTESADQVANFVKKEGLHVHYILETHAHADHVSGSQILKKHYRKPRLPSAPTSQRCRRSLRMSSTLRRSFLRTAVSSIFC